MSIVEEKTPNPTIEEEEEEDDPPLLSSKAIEALREFLSEQQNSSKVVEDDEVKLVAEDWRLSQFWYDRETAEAISSEIRYLSESTSSSVACVACPTLYTYLKSKECLEKVAQTISFLAHPQKQYLLLLTGEAQKERAAELLALHPCGFRPQHSNKLGNEFLLFTNYDPGDRLGGWERNQS